MQTRTFRINLIHFRSMLFSEWHDWRKTQLCSFNAKSCDCIIPCPTASEGGAAPAVFARSLQRVCGGTAGGITACLSLRCWFTGSGGLRTSAFVTLKRGLSGSLSHLDFNYLLNCGWRATWERAGARPVQLSISGTNEPPEEETQKSRNTFVYVFH